MPQGFMSIESWAVIQNGTSNDGGVVADRQQYYFAVDAEGVITAEIDPIPIFRMTEEGWASIQGGSHVEPGNITSGETTYKLEYDSSENSIDPVPIW